VPARRPFRLVRPRQRGFRHWLLENYYLLYTLVLIAAYASLMLYFVALVVFGGASLVSKTLIGIFGTFVVIALAPWIKRGGGDPELGLRNILTMYRRRTTERFELIVAVTLWSLIGVALVFLLFARSR
jgi:hypothetical protein